MTERKAFELLPFVGIVLILSVLLSTSLFADSDGSYCIGNGYLAFEVRGWRTGGLHLLKLVRFEKGKVHWGGQVQLEDFQLHEMICEADKLRISGWGKNYISYSIDLLNKKGPQVVEKVEDKEIKWTPSLFEPEPPNLGDWSRPGIVELPSSERNYRYRLVILKGTKENKIGWETQIKTSVIATDRKGNTISQLTIYESTVFNSKGE